MRARTLGWVGVAGILCVVCACASSSSDGGDNSPQPDSGAIQQGQDSGAPDATLEDTTPPPEDTSPPVDTGSFSSDTGAKDSASEAASPNDATTDGPAETSTTDGMVTDGSAHDTGMTPPSDGGTPTTCAQANQTVGCCSGSGELYYCSSTTMTLKSKTCASGTVCGWDSTNSYYGCVAPPAEADPSGMYPMACQ